MVGTKYQPNWVGVDLQTRTAIFPGQWQPGTGIPVLLWASTARCRQRTPVAQGLRWKVFYWYIWHILKHVNHRHHHVSFLWHQNCYQHQFHRYYHNYNFVHTGAVSCEFEALQQAICLSQTIPFYRTICRRRQNEEEVSYIIPLGRPMETLSSVMLIFFTI